MAYRDDFEAALEQAAALSKDLEHARSEHAHDLERISALETQLAAAKARADSAQARAEAERSSAPGFDRGAPSSSEKSGKRKSRSQSSRSAPGDTPPSADASAALEDAKAAFSTEPPSPPGPWRSWMIFGLLAVTTAGAVVYLEHDASPPSAPKLVAPPAPTVRESEPPPKPRGFDVLGSLPAAAEQARKEFADAELSSIEADYVDADGAAELGYGGVVTYGFRSTERADAKEPPRTEPIGAPHRWKPPACIVDVYTEKSGLRSSVQNRSRGSHCAAALPGPPRCTLAQVWKRANEHGAPEHALAHVRLAMHGKEARWNLRVRDAGHELFSMEQRDDCDASPAR